MNNFMQTKQEELDSFNNIRKHYLKQRNLKDAFLYAPHWPEEYWNKDNLRIAFCNEETHIGDGTFKAGINTLDRDTLCKWTDPSPTTKKSNQTINNIFVLNYFIRNTLKRGILPSIQDIKDFKTTTKNRTLNEGLYDSKYEEMDKSLYFNLRNSIAPETKEHTSYLIREYKNQENIDYIKNLLTITDPHILILGSECCCNIFVNQIYPEDFGNKLVYCKKPKILENRLIISIPHPSRISNEAMITVIKKIKDNISLIRIK